MALVERPSRPKIRLLEPPSPRFHLPREKTLSEPQPLLGMLMISWSTLAPAQRGAYLSKLADLILENLEELGHLEAYDTGKPVSMASGEIWFAAETYRYYAGWATKLSGRSFDLSLQADPYHCATLRQPIGVVGGI